MEELLNSIDNWTIIKLVGGLTLVISSLISFIAYFIKDSVINKWKSNYQKELELLKADSAKNNSILNNLTNSISHIYLSSNTKRIDALELVWSNMMRIKENQPNLTMMSYSILIKSEFLKIPYTDNKYTRASVDEFRPEEYFEKHHKLVKEISVKRPFIGEKLWSIFFTYQAFLGRLNFLLQDGLKKGELTYWHDDLNFIKQVLRMAIKQEEMDKLLVDNITSFHNILNFLEFKAINDINEQITGKRMTEESVNYAIELSKITKNTIA